MVLLTVFSYKYRWEPLFRILSVRKTKILLLLYALRVTGFALPVARYVLRFTRYVLRVACCALRFVLYTVERQSICVELSEPHCVRVVLKCPDGGASYLPYLLSYLPSVFSHI